MVDQRGPTPAGLIADHVALPAGRPAHRAFVRLNMVGSVDGASAVAGVSGALGNRDDHAVYRALRAGADGVLVGAGTVIAEHYRPPETPGLRIYVVASRPDVSAAEALLSSGSATLVLPEDAGPASVAAPELRAGTGVVDLPQVLSALAGQVIVAEGGPSLAGTLVARGLVDEVFLTVSPRVVGGTSPRIAHGPDADPAPWQLRHGFADDDGFLFLRYARLDDPAG